MAFSTRFLALFVIFLFSFAILGIGIRSKLRAIAHDANIENTGTDHQPPPAGPRKKVRPGPKPLPLEARSFRQRVGLIKKVRRAYRRVRKVEVILFLMHHQVPISVRVENTQFRQPTHSEASISVVHEPSGLEPFEPGGATSRASSSPGLD